jgi:hypothetical protein
MATLGQTIVLFGGENASYLPDTWIWDGSEWSQQFVDGPTARSGAAMSAF